MPAIRTIPVAEAPARPPQLLHLADELARAITLARCGDVLVVTPSADETLALLASAVDHVAARRGVWVDSWIAPDEDALYVRRC